MDKLYVVPEYLIKKYIPEHIAKIIQEVHLDLMHKFGSGCTVGEQADLQGITIFDSALPNDWVKSVKDATGLNPVGNFVMNYSDNPMGEPTPVTLEGNIIYKIYKHVTEK